MLIEDRPSSRRTEVHAFGESATLARVLAGHLTARLRHVDVHRFPDGESRVRARCCESSRAIVVRSLADPNARLVELMFAADALRRQGAEPVVLIAPYLGYMRQDCAFEPGDAISQQVVGEMLGRAFDQVLTVEAHLHRIKALAEVIPCQARSISAAPLIARWCKEQAAAGGTSPDAAASQWVVVGPDAESAPWVGAIAEDAALPRVVCRKERSGDRRVRVEIPALPLGTRCAWIVDDIASSGATLAATARGLRARGVERVEAIVVHALFEPGAEERLLDGGIDRIVSTDTIAHPTNAIGVSPLLADALAGTA